MDALSHLVGYNSADHTDKQYVSLGAGFATIEDSDVFVLGSFKPSTWSFEGDNIQVLNNSAASVIAKYSYFGTWEGATPGEDEGWWDPDFNNMYDDAEFPIGAAFLGNFTSKDAVYQQSGAVLKGGSTLDYIGKQYVMFGNPLPKTIKLGDVKPFEGCWSFEGDNIQVLNNTAASVIAKYSYFGTWEGATPGEDEGWWDPDFNNQFNDLDVNAGDAWLGNFTSKDVKLAWPGALD